MALNILIVDDSDVIRAMIARTLRLTQLPIGDVHNASNGREALEMLDEAWIDLVLADINMPVMDGTEMLERMRSHSETADVPVIVVSSEGATDRVHDLMGKGVSAWIRKPFTPEEIRDVIERVTADWPATEEHHQQMDAVFGPVLETFAFAFAESCSLAELPDPGSDLFSARITFSGATSGTMTLVAPSALCTELAANILGIEPGDPDARMRGADTLGEIANIASGHLATYIDPVATTDLHPPVVVQFDRADWDRLATIDSTRAYVIEEHPVLVSVGLRPTARAAAAS